MGSRRASSVLNWAGLPWTGGTLLLIVGALAVFFLTVPDTPAMTAVPTDFAGDIALGPPGATSVMLEYADFECGACAGYSKLLAPLRAEYQDRVLFVYRFFPLKNHRYGMISAQAAYAAHLQGKFWEMHDVLYENQREWVESADPQPFFDEYAAALGLDLERFHQDMAAPSTTELITKQKAEAAAAGVKHTPWFVINGQVVQPRTADEFRELIEAGLR